MRGRMTLGSRWLSCLETLVISFVFLLPALGPAVVRAWARRSTYPGAAMRPAHAAGGTPDRGGRGVSARPLPWEHPRDPRVPGPRLVQRVHPGPGDPRTPRRDRVRLLRREQRPLRIPRGPAGTSTAPRPLRLGDRRLPPRDRGEPDLAA